LLGLFQGKDLSLRNAFLVTLITAAEQGTASPLGTQFSRDFSNDSFLRNNKYTMALLNKINCLSLL
ncbi:MAG: hypothetical protein ACPGVL_17900, partial [Pseudoalteromonas spongiae]